MFIAALFIIAKKSKLHKGLSTDEWLSIACYAHKIENYSAIERDEVYAIIWIDVGKMQSERSQTQRATYYMILSI